MIEHKSAPDEWVAFQLLRYMVKIWEPLAKERAGKLPPIFPLVFYHGKTRWKIARNLAALIDFDGPELLRPYVPNFEYQIFDLSEYRVDQLRGAVTLRLALLAMKNYFGPDQSEKIAELLDAAKGLRSEGTDGLEFLLTVLRYYVSVAKTLKQEDLRKAVRRVFPEREGIIMSTLAERWAREGREEGLQRGREEGRQQAIADLTLVQLDRKLGRVSATARRRILRLPAAKLRELGVALLDFNSSKDLAAWLAEEA